MDIGQPSVHIRVHQVLFDFSNLRKNQTKEAISLRMNEYHIHLGSFIDFLGKKTYRRKYCLFSLCCVTITAEWRPISNGTDLFLLSFRAQRLKIHGDYNILHPQKFSWYLVMYTIPVLWADIV
jgi:hypothetical protein